MNLLLFLYLLASVPKLLWDRVVRGKRHPAFLQRMGFFLPKIGPKKIWIHAVSVGEIKAAFALYKEWKKQEPTGSFWITTTTFTGYEEARRLFLQEEIGYLPFDFSWSVRRWVKEIAPRHFVLVETDFWIQLLKELKKKGVLIHLVSGKLSEKSYSRFSQFPNFSKRLFSLFDHLCVQNKEYKSRFLPFVDPKRVAITGNLKQDLEPVEVQKIWSTKVPMITVSCTHPNEEALILDQIDLDRFFLVLAPRHPERFATVAHFLLERKIPFARWSTSNQDLSKVKLLLVDTMGVLPICYVHSRLVILGGSYVPHIGGHNVLEPSLYGVPLFFGPHTFGQKELVTQSISMGAGKCVLLEDLKQALEIFFENSIQEEQMKQGARRFASLNRGTAYRTLCFLEKRFGNNDLAMLS